MSALGGAFAIVLFAGTLTLLLTTPGVYQEAGSPQLSPRPGQFLAKDLLLFAVAIWVVGDSLAETSRRRRSTDHVEQSVG
ncbi:MAG: DUF417 family protein [Geodermatophilaceae bacterium]